MWEIIWILLSAPIYDPHIEKFVGAYESNKTCNEARIELERQIRAIDRGQDVKDAVLYCRAVPIRFTSKGEETK